MELYEYLMQELGLDEELARKIAEKTREYHHVYGHKHGGHGHDHNKELNPDEMIVESKEEVAYVKENAALLHCNGCENQCSLDNPRCGRGRALFEKLAD